VLVEQFSFGPGVSQLSVQLRSPMEHERRNGGPAQNRSDHQARQDV
jgi:hypothetical protein